ncbi:hypothetical protein TRVL_10145 [Trypanosoma vivax]|nr:hypothetical protein TRVL_10145 [Trypanosoma vivax]
MGPHSQWEKQILFWPRARCLLIYLCECVPRYKTNFQSSAKLCGSTARNGMRRAPDCCHIALTPLPHVVQLCGCCALENRCVACGKRDRSISDELMSYEPADSVQATSEPPQRRSKHLTFALPFPVLINQHAS